MLPTLPITAQEKCDAFAKLIEGIFFPYRKKATVKYKQLEAEMLWTLYIP